MMCCENAARSCSATRSRAAAFSAVGALTAWRHARRSGQGQVVDVSMLEALTLCLNGPYQAMASQWFPDLVTHRTIEVPSIEQAADGAVGFCTQTAQQWQDFTVLIGHPELGEEPALRSADQRMAQRERVGAAIHDALEHLSVDAAIELAVALRVPVAPVGNGAVLTGIDHFAARGVYQPGPDGVLRPRPAFRLGAAPLRPLGAPPALGADAATSLDDLWPARPTPVPEGASPDERPLAGLRVVDLTAFWAGPFATTYLAALGADVVKVESTKRPDGIRFLGGFAQDRSWEWSMVYAGANPGKRDLTLDLEQAEGRALLTRLVEGADVVVENWSARVLDSFGFGWDRISAINPRAVLVRMPAFGLDGPWRDRTGFAMTIEQVSGLAWVTGYEDLPLVPRGPCDPLGGMHAVFALLCALEDRRRTGVGQLVEVPLVEAALNIAAEQVLEHQAYGVLLGRSANRGPYAAPQGLYPTSGEDEWLALAVATDEQWEALCGVLGEEALAADPALAAPAGRRAAHDRIDEAIRSWAVGHAAEDAERLLLGAGVPASYVWPGHRAHHHPQLHARRFLQPMDHEVTGRSGYPSFPMQFSAFGPHLFRSPPPLLGEHNDELLAELGVGVEEAASLRADKVVGDRPNWL
jgi:crotonobetainyl-CoA:carnitine CoA-transferase CaiB-like acyl-CoA transferase